VTLKDGRTVTNTKDMADYFERQHKDVLRSVNLLITTEPSIERNFTPIEIEAEVGFGTRKVPAFEMDRDGFTLLAMGFTGPKALKFKIAYIEQFDAMEAGNLYRLSCP
jgi:Rha family phage regulatory protein